jgi:phosphatidylglycerol:prolipoprotein diacylglycerol transferase
MLVEINLFGLQVRTFGLAFAAAFLLAALLISRRLREIDRPPDWAWELMAAALVGGVVGSRGYFILQNGTGGDLGSTAFSSSGLIWYGGVVGGAIAVCLWAWFRRFLGLALLDLVAPALALGYAVGRIGCQLTGDGTYGKPSDLPWAMGYPHGVMPTPPGVTVHPTPVYETIAMGLVALWLWRHRKSFHPGALFAWYLVLAGTERLLVEFLRRNEHVLLGLTAAQIESVVMIAIGSAWLVWLKRSGRLRRGSSVGAATPLPAG